MSDSMDTGVASPATPSRKRKSRSTTRTNNESDSLTPTPSPTASPPGTNNQADSLVDTPAGSSSAAAAAADVPSQRRSKRRKTNSRNNAPTPQSITSAPSTPSPSNRSTNASVDPLDEEVEGNVSRSSDDSVEPLPAAPNLDNLPDEQIHVTVKPSRMTPRKDDIDELNYLLSDSPPRRSFPRDVPFTDHLHKRGSLLAASTASAAFATPLTSRSGAYRQVKFTTPPPSSISGNGLEYKFTRPVRLANAAIRPPTTPQRSSSASHILSAHLTPLSYALPSTTIIVEESKSSDSSQLVASRALF